MSKAKQTALVELYNTTIYQLDKPVLNKVNLEVKKGEFIYLVGRTGTGKSSLLKTLYGDLPLKDGVGYVAGFDLKSLNWRTLPFLRRKLGIIFQDFQLLMDRNVMENLKFALEVTGWANKKEIEERVDIVLHNVYMYHKKYEMPYKLSGGEQQRVAIARALLNEPELILADEPTGNLDPETSDDIINLIYQICEETETTAIIGTHNYDFIDKYKGKILSCEENKLISK
ncbi:UNVERIFIED_CONTAM: hypothetical protein GTU68_027416 [Idotea baltica]|nr:hypothetical protein [Idotea baltica]